MTWKWIPRRLLRATLRRAAVDYARHGWAVLPGAYPDGQRFTCGNATCPTVARHPVHRDAPGDIEASLSLKMINTWWHKHPYSVLLPTGQAFDVLEVPGYVGALVTRILAEHGPRGPIAVAPTGRWLLFVATGEPLRPELDRQLDLVHHGRGSWIPAPPSLHVHGRLRWEVPPAEVNWVLPESYPVQHAIVDALQLAAPRQAA